MKDELLFVIDDACDLYVDQVGLNLNLSEQMTDYCFFIILEFSFFSVNFYSTF